MAEPMIEFREVTKRYAGLVANDRFSLAVRPGELMTLLGPSGCGKTTALRCLTGILRPDSGHILLDGNDVTDVPTHQRELGMVFQNFALFPHMTVLENVAFPLHEKTRLPEEEILKRARQRLAQVNLSSEVEGKYPDELSGGMKKRVALARALVQEPEILLFDEPVTGLDPPMMNTVFHLITKTHQESGYTGMVVSHDIPAVFGIADYVAMLHQGRIVAWGTPAEIQANPDPVIQGFLRGEIDFQET